MIEPHAPIKMNGIPWPVCKKCGLVYLRNALTQWRIKQGCDSEDHPQFKQKVKQYAPV